MTTEWKRGAGTVNPALSPVGVATAVRHLPGMAFFDSSGHWPAGQNKVISRLAVMPKQILRGNLADASALASLRCALEDGAQFGGRTGGLAGWITYEGDYVFGDYSESLVFDHRLGIWLQPSRVREWLEHDANPQTIQVASLGEFRQKVTREKFLAAVNRAQEWIASGDIYQVNLSQSFEAEVIGGSLFGLYLALRETTPAPMSGWFSLENHEILCSSPECFLQLRGNRLWTYPIKGTRPRGADSESDFAAMRELRESAKENAELVMITDLLRNDLGKVCEFGTVKVEELLRIETLEQVHHLVSTVSGELKPGLGILEVLAACFPGGSITGAPKKRAMEIIQALELVPRGVYCGSICWLGFDGSASCNIAIRTMVREDNRLSYHCGAGIVADSEAQMEYEETLHKAVGIRLAIERWKATERGHRSK